MQMSICWQDEPDPGTRDMRVSQADRKMPEGVRNMELGQAQEDYLEAIYVLREQKGQVKCVHIAEYMERSKPTILTAMNVLEEKGYIEKDRHSLLLTPKGEELARRIYERHQYFKELLEQAGVKEETADREACVMEHVLSEDSYEKLKKYLGQCPDFQ